MKAGRARTQAASQSRDRCKRDGDCGGKPRQRYEGERKGAGEDVQRDLELTRISLEGAEKAGVAGR